MHINADGVAGHVVVPKLNLKLTAKLDLLDAWPT